MAAIRKFCSRYLSQVRNGSEYVRRYCNSKPNDQHGKVLDSFRRHYNGLADHTRTNAVSVNKAKTSFSSYRGMNTSAEYTKEAQKKAWVLAGPVGMVAGLFGSLVGVGGGVLIVPIITGAVTVPQRIVTGSSLAAVISTGSMSALTYSDFGLVDFQSAAVLAASAMLFAPAGAKMTTKLDCKSLRRVLGYFLLAAGPLVPLKYFLLAGGKQGEGKVDTKQDEETRPEGEGPAEETQDWFSLRNAQLVGIGGCAGFASGLLGIGGGTIVTPLLALCTTMSQPAIVGTSLLAMIPPSAVGLAQHSSLGNVDRRLAVALGLGTAFGSIVGSNVAVRSPDGLLECVFGIGMIFLGWRTLRSIK